MYLYTAEPSRLEIKGLSARGPLQSLPDKIISRTR